MAQQTAVNWLLEQIENKNGKEFTSYYTEFIEQAKAIEKSSIMAAYMRGSSDIIKLINLELVTIAEQYYNETYTNGL